MIRQKNKMIGSYLQTNDAQQDLFILIIGPEDISV